MPEVARLSSFTAAEIRIGKAQRSDLDDLVALEASAFVSDRLSRRSFCAHARSDRADLLVARHAMALAGYALVLSRRGSAASRLYSLAVAEAWAGHGLGAALLSAAETRALARGAKYLRLEVRADNAAAIRLYESCGYRRTGRKDAYYADGAPALCYERALCKAPGRSAPRPSRLGEAA